MMNIVHGLYGHRCEFIEHGKVGGVQQFQQKLRSHRYAWQRFRCMARITARRRVISVWRTMRVTVFREPLARQLRCYATHLIESRFWYRTQLLIVHEQQGGHNFQTILCIHRFHLWQWAPIHILITILLPATQIVRIQTLFLMINWCVRQHRHAKWHHFRLAIVGAHLDVINAQQQCLNAAATLLVAHGHRIQIRVDECRHKLQRESFQFRLIRSIVAE